MALCWINSRAMLAYPKFVHGKTGGNPFELTQ